MKFFVTFALLVAAAAAVPVSPSGDPKDAQVLRYENSNIGTPDGYSYAVETSNGIAQQEQGALKNVGTENEALQVRGQFSYPGPDGVLYTLQYIADENGFQPSGAHLPVPPV